MFKIKKKIDALIGYTGFVGKEIKNQKNFQKFYNSKNINKIKNNNFDLVVCAGAPGLKWYANKYPNDDKKKIQKLINCLKNIQVKEKFILISTVDVFSKIKNIDERSTPIPRKNNFYGANRLDLENFVKKKFKTKYLIVRLPGLVGDFLKKNFLFDLKHNKLINLINPNSVFQYYPIQNIWSDIQMAIDKKIKLIHLNAEPIKLKNIIFLKLKKFNKKEFNKQNKIFYDMKSIYAKKLKNKINYFYSKKYVLNVIKNYFNEN